jgi:hypothetical protein
MQNSKNKLKIFVSNSKRERSRMPRIVFTFCPPRDSSIKDDDSTASDGLGVRAWVRREVGGKGVGRLLVHNGTSSVYCTPYVQDLRTLHAPSYHEISKRS